MAALALFSAPAPSDAPPRVRVHPVATLLHVAPVCAVSALLCVPIFERDVLHSGSAVLGSARARAELAASLCVVAACVFCLQLAEFWLVRLTSSLTLSVFGLVKELCTIALSAAVLGDYLSPVNLVGLGLSTVGSAVYLAGTWAVAFALRSNACTAATP